MKIDIKTEDSVFIELNGWTYYIDDSTGEQIIEKWPIHMNDDGVNSGVMRYLKRNNLRLKHGSDFWDKQWKEVIKNSSNRVVNSVTAAGIKTMFELLLVCTEDDHSRLRYPPILNFRNFGKKGYIELIKELNKYVEKTKDDGWEYYRHCCLNVMSYEKVLMMERNGEFQGLE